MLRTSKISMAKSRGEGPEVTRMELLSSCEPLCHTLQAEKTLEGTKAGNGLKRCFLCGTLDSHMQTVRVGPYRAATGILREQAQRVL